jgi:hypothetical protein
LQKGGVAIAITVPDVINCAHARARCVEQLVDLATCGVPVAVRPTGFEPGESAALVEFFRILAAGRAQAGLESAELEVTIDASHAPPDAAYYLARHRFGAGAVNVLADAAAFARWQDWLWRTRLDARRRFACWPLVRSSSPLLAAEPACDVLPGVALQVPVQTAWLCARVQLDRFVRPGGELDPDTLGRELEDIVDAADRMHDEVDWATPAMRQDAWLNRRLAIRLDGIGDLVRALGLDPGRHGTLESLKELFGFLRGGVFRRSRQLAGSGEILPAIAAGAPHGAAADEERAFAWRQRWLHAVRLSATRHRNLLAMSPWSVFPGGDPDFRYADLLPLLEHADCCAIDGQPPLGSWSRNKYVAFHARLRAIQHKLCAGYVVAEQH